MTLDRIRNMCSRAYGSAVIWSWAFNSLRLASGLLLLPLLLRLLDRSEFGMNYLFLSVMGFLPFLDLGFTASLSRSVSYAAGGVSSLQPEGLASPAQASGQPNFKLLRQLFYGVAKIYRYIAVFGVILLGGGGTLLVFAKAGETPHPQITWAAWILTLLAAALELYTGWWNSFLVGLNRVTDSARISFLGYAVRLTLACVLLLAGGGLLSMPISALVGIGLTRCLIRREVLGFLGTAWDTQDKLATSGLFRVLWPNSWRLALQMLSYYLRTQANVPVCTALFGLAATADYGLSLQVFSVASGMAMVWTNVKWPTVARLRSVGDVENIQKLLWPRFWMQIFTFLLISGVAIAVGPWLLGLWSADKHLLPAILLILMGINTLADIHCGFWGTLLVSENRIPTLWALVSTNVFSISLAFILGKMTSLGVAALVIAPLVSSLVFIHWHWARIGARSIGTTWPSFVLSGFRRAGVTGRKVEQR